MSLIKLKNNALDNLTSFEGSASLGDMVLVSSATASSSASIEFTLGDLKEYKFFFVNIHPQTDIVDFTFQTSIDSGSTYGITTTNTYFWTQHNDSNTYAELEYRTDNDLAQSTSFIKLTDDIGNDNDSSACGFLHLFNPSSTTYVKHYIGNVQIHTNGDASRQVFTAGYFNDTNDLTNIKFQMSSGNIDDGKILMFGLN